MMVARLKSFALFLILLSFMLGGMSRPLEPTIKSIKVVKPSYMAVKSLVAEAGDNNHSKRKMVRKLVVDEAGPSPRGEGHSIPPTYY
ncbi:uncharacterized protein DS421_9g279730 [Arachis hypogaea]|nr:uncharacterized protein DS421_9g279730 [Arachis hypogaea]